MAKSDKKAKTDIEKAGKADDKTPKKISMAKKLEQAMAKIHKNHGVEAIQQGRGTIAPVTVWPSQIANLDIALGCGGIPRGRIIELFGGESSGKTTTTLELAAACQRTEFVDDGGEVRNGVVAFVDAEHAMDPKWAGRLGVNLDKLLFSQPSSGEEALDIVINLAEAGVDLVVVDSVANLVPKEELDGNIDDYSIGAQARMMSKAMRMLASVASKSGSTVVFINQIRDKIGVLYGSPETTPGGKALKFYSSIRIKVRQGTQVKRGATFIGRECIANVVKNKIAAPFVTASYNIMFDSEKGDFGIDKITPLIDAAKRCEVIGLNGSQYRYPVDAPVVKANGWDKFVAELRSRPELIVAIREQTYERVLGDRVEAPPAVEYDEEVADRLDDDEDIEQDDD